MGKMVASYNTVSGDSAKRLLIRARFFGDISEHGIIMRRANCLVPQHQLRTTLNSQVGPRKCCSLVYSTIPGLPDIKGISNVM